jgi:hypothetical protein
MQREQIGSPVREADVSRGEENCKVRPRGWRMAKIQDERDSSEMGFDSQKKAVLPCQFQADALIIYVFRIFIARVKMAYVILPRATVLFLRRVDEASPTIE